MMERLLILIHGLSIKERAFVYVGLGVIGFCIGLVFIQNMIMPLLNDHGREIFSVSGLCLALLAGSTILVYGLCSPLKALYADYMLLHGDKPCYKLMRYTVLSIWIVLRFCVRFFVALVLQKWEDPQRSNQNFKSPLEQDKDNSNRIWNHSPKHFYDKEPPKTFE